MFYSIFDQNNEALVSKINVFLNIKNKILLTSKRLKGSVYIYLQIIFFFQKNRNLYQTYIGTPSTVLKSMHFTLICQLFVKHFYYIKRIFTYKKKTFLEST